MRGWFLLWVCLLPIAVADEGAARQRITLSWEREDRTREVGLELRWVERSGRRYEVRGERLWYRQLGGERRPWPDYDSATSTGEPPVHLPWQGTAMEALLGQSVEVELDAQGRAIAVRDWQEAFDGMIASFRTEEQVSEGDVAEYRGRFEATLLSSIFNVVGWSPPAAALEPGARWSATRSSELGSVRSEFTVRAIEAETIAIEVGGALGGGSQTGRLLLDRRSHRVREATIEQRTASGSLTHRIRLEPL